MKNRKPFQKFLIAIAAISYLAAVGCGVIASTMDIESTDPVFASLLASAFFFACVGVVLQVIGSVNLPSLKVDR